MASKKPFFDIILACSKNRGIGNQGKLPWDLPNEMKHFMKTTKTPKGSSKQNVVISGRKTFLETKPLPNRINIVISNSLKPEQIKQEFPGTHVLPSIDTSLEYIQNELSEKYRDIFFIGGAQLYEQAANHDQCRLFYHTKICQEFPCDAILPENYLENFDHLETSKTQWENDIPYLFQIYLNKNFKGNFIKTKNILDSRHEEFQYLDIIEDIMKNGKKRSDRTGTGVVGKFGETMRFDLSSSFPLLTTKKVFFRGVAEELIWFIQACTNSKVLSEKKIKIWDGNGSREFLDSLGFKDREEGDLGPVYGFQWRHFGAKYTNMHADYKGQGVDQLQNLINEIKRNPTSRRLLLSAWNPADLSKMALPPCHILSQYYVQDNKLSCLMYQRSCDMGLGIPFNIASYSLLTCMIAEVCGLQRGEFIHMLGDAHVYSNHIDALQDQIKRVPNHFPQLKFKRKVTDIDDFKYSDFDLIGYDPLPTIKMKMAV